MFFHIQSQQQLSSFLGRHLASLVHLLLFHLIRRSALTAPYIVQEWWRPRIPQRMATYLSQHQEPLKQPHQELPSNTPPDQLGFHTNRISSHMAFNGSRNQFKVSGDHRGNGAANGNRTLPTPTGPHAHILNGGQRTFGGAAMFDGSRSPPSTKSMRFLSIDVLDLVGLTRSDTAHVPCKFFKIGQCQAGKACPFSHSTDTSKFETPCKYFAKVRSYPKRYGDQ